jgi:hypothetical protein
LVGYWRVTVDDAAGFVVFRLRLPDGSFRDLYRADFTADEGWKTGR